MPIVGASIHAVIYTVINDPGLKQTFKALLMLNRGSVWEIARTSGQLPPVTEVNLRRLEALDLVTKVELATPVPLTPHSTYYRLTEFAYTHLGLLRRLLG